FPLCSRIARRSGSRVAATRCAYQSIACNSSTTLTTARCTSRTFSGSRSSGSWKMPESSAIAKELAPSRGRRNPVLRSHEDSVFHPAKKKRARLRGIVDDLAHAGERLARRDARERPFLGGAH